ncbi:hypothetical protein ACP8HI_19685 [Paenibacillus sp. FA6]|uniref:hypothetical protein n=1 Tax=Paenibacillus sp. FA6 TaxID=3413029 RepID=UPI003F658C3B
MKILLKLYPKKWRNRYGDEFLFLLEKRNLSFKNVTDIILNALDTRLLLFVEGLHVELLELSRQHNKKTYFFQKAY